MARSPAQVVVVGGGIAGLSTAFFLAERAAATGLPLACTLLESSSAWGGKIVTERVGDFLIEGGPDSFLSQKPWALELIAKLGLADRVINTDERHKQTFVYSRGRLRVLPEGLVLIVPTRLGPFVRSGLISWPGLARMGLDLVLPARRDEADESLASFFRRRLGREAFERVVEPLMAGIYAGDAEQISLKATFPRFLELERRYGSLIRGMLAARAAAPPPTPGAPARTMFLSLRGGMGELVCALAERVKAMGVEMKTGCRVVGLHGRPGAGGRTAYELRPAEGPPLRADAVVLATPAFASADLLDSLEPRAAALLRQIPYASTATVSLAYETASVRNTVRGFGFVVPRVERRSLIAATWSSLKWPHRAPEGRTLVRCYLGGLGREEALRGDGADLIGLAREELRRLVGLAAEPACARAYKWDRALPQYTLGHLERLARLERALADHPALRLTGAAYRGVGVPDCIRDAADTAAAVLAGAAKP